jgi:hypothetical protein
MYTDLFHVNKAYEIHKCIEEIESLGCPLLHLSVIPTETHKNGDNSHAKH